MGRCRHPPPPPLRRGALSRGRANPSQPTRHEGLYAPHFTPLYRGFNSSNGFLTGGEDHYTLVGDTGLGNCGVAKGPAVRDVFINNRTAPAWVGNYTGTRFANAAVDIISNHPAGAPLFLYLALHNTHAPLEAEPEDLALYANITWKKQQTYYAMATAVDRTVGRVVAALKARGFWESSLVLWSTDNGAPVQVGGSNGPQRGGKGSNWEGGVHQPAVWGGGLIPPSRRGVELPRAAAGAFAIADAHATFLARAGLPLADPNPRAPAPVDGLDVWDWVLGSGAPMSPRITAGLPLDHLNYPFQNRGLVGAYIKGDLKLIVGAPGGEGQAAWYGGPPAYFTPNASMPMPPINVFACDQAVAPGGCLFNLTSDPNEHEDIAAAQPALFAAMMADFVALNSTYHPPWIVPPSEEKEACAVALLPENDVTVAPWRAEPYPQDM